MPTDDKVPYYYDECSHCNGTGDDGSEWDDRCTYCNGRGEVKRYLDEDE